MRRPAFLAALFEEEPGRWGLRGDPHLWADMQQRFEGVECPATRDDLAALVEVAFAELTGCPISHPHPIFVERYSHGGMSSGHVSPEFWRETALPLLEGRLPAPPAGHAPEGKSERILAVISELRRRFGSRAFEVVDYWPDDPDLIGVARAGEYEPCVSISTAGKAEGRFDIEHDGTVFPDCVLQGLTGTVSKELRRERPNRRLAG